MTVNELYRILDNAYPVSLRSEWDNDGLMLTLDGNALVKRVLCTLDVTPDVCRYAALHRYDLIVSHHPLIFFPLRSLDGKNITARKCLSLLQNGISVFSFHTRLDAVSGGVNDTLAKLLGVYDTEPFGLENEKMGRIGVLREPCDVEAFASMAAKVLQAEGVRYVAGGKKVYRVALLGGDGKDFIDAAVSAGADTYITGRLSYNTIIEAPEKGINLVEAGHFYTEHPVTSVLQDKIREILPDVTVDVYNSNLVRVIK